MIVTQFVDRSSFASFLHCTVHSTSSFNYAGIHSPVMLLICCWLLLLLPVVIHLLLLHQRIMVVACPFWCLLIVCPKQIVGVSHVEERTPTFTWIILIRLHLGTRYQKKMPGQWTMLQELYWILPLCHIRLFLWWYWWNWSNYPLEFIAILGVCSFLWCSTSPPQAQAQGAMGPMKAASHTTWSFVHHNFLEESSILIKGGWTWIDPIRKLIRPHSIYLGYNGIGLICV